MVKATISLLAIGCLMALAWLAWNQHTTIVAARTEAALLRQERDSVLARLELEEARADSNALVIDSLIVTHAVERRVAVERATELGEKADSLAGELVGLVPPGPIQDSVAIVIREIQTTYEQRILDLGNLLRLRDETVVAMQRQIQLKDQAMTSLRRALALAEDEAEAWERAANPGILVRVRRAAVPVGVASLVGFAIGFTR